MDDALFSDPNRRKGQSGFADTQWTFLCRWQRALWRKAAGGRAETRDRAPLQRVATLPAEIVASGRVRAQRAERTIAAMPIRRFLSFRDFDWALLGLVLLLCSLSVLEVHSATVHTRFASFGTKQICLMCSGHCGACLSWPRSTITA